MPIVPMSIGRGRKIQLDSKVPYYLQLRDLLDALIDAGQLKPGDKLPSEAELCEEFGVSRRPRARGRPQEAPTRRQGANR